MQSKRQTVISKKLSYFLRHNLDAIAGPVDLAGYVSIDSLLQMPDFVSTSITKEEILQVVEKSDKNRFGLDSTRTKIRANQGHSLKSGALIDETQLLTKILVPLDYCVHGTTRKAILQIKETGLSRMGRTHIHFASKPNALSGFRSDSSVLIYIDMAKAMTDGIEFFMSENGVILSVGVVSQAGVVSPIDPKYFTRIDYLS